MYRDRVERIRKIDEKVKELQAKKRELLSVKSGGKEEHGKLYRLVVLKFLWFKVVFVRQLRWRRKPQYQTVEKLEREGNP